MTGTGIGSLALFAAPACGLVLGVAAWRIGAPEVAAWLWSAGTLPVLAAQLVHILQGLRRREAGLDIIAALAMAGALALDEHLTSVVIALMVATGQGLDAYAATRAAREMTALLGRAPRTAHRYDAGQVVPVAVDSVRPGDRLLIRAGDVLPVDGTVTGGDAILDESALTGEPLPIRHPAGAAVRSGTVNAGAAFDLRAASPAEESTYAGIVRLVQTAQRSKAPSSRLADRYALMFVPLTLALAGLAWVLTGTPERALAVVVVATPCPLILAVPVAIVSGMSRCARRGVLVKSAGAHEALAAVRVLLFDKTGTLTGGRARVIAIDAGPGHSSSEVLQLAASLDQASQHPLAQSIIAAARARSIELSVPSEVTEHPGRGLEGVVGGHRVAVGSYDYVAGHAPVSEWRARHRPQAEGEGAASVFVAIDGRTAGSVLLADEIRLETPRSLRLLRKAGVRRMVMVTGDRRDVAEAIGAALDLDDVVADCTPADKAAVVEQERRHGPTMMVGDGINDGPALARADVGVAMGARGAAVSSQAADVVLLVDRLDRLAEAVRIARRSRRIALQSVLAGMGLSVAAMMAAGLGYLPPLSGAVLQEGIDVAVILNALRALGGIRIGHRREILSDAEARRLKAEHETLLPVLDRIRATGDRLAGETGLPPREELIELGALLRERLLRHEQEDDTIVYPRVAELIGGEDPMAAMSRGHREVRLLVRTYGRMLDAMADAPADPGLRHDLQRILYSLDAILRLHFAQEEEIYSALADAA